VNHLHLSPGMVLDPEYNVIYPLHDDERSFPTRLQLWAATLLPLTVKQPHEFSFAEFCRVRLQVVSYFHSVTSYEDMGSSQIMNSVHGLLQFIHVASYVFRHSCR
jgi:hypothetical protein